jgi:hypothetical protein
VDSGRIHGVEDEGETAEVVIALEAFETDCLDTNREAEEEGDDAHGVETPYFWNELYVYVSTFELYQNLLLLTAVSPISGKMTAILVSHALYVRDRKNKPQLDYRKPTRKNPD